MKVFNQKNLVPMISRLDIHSNLSQGLHSCQPCSSISCSAMQSTSQ